MLVVPILLWALLNLVFSTAFGTGVVERRIENQLGLPCQIESISWSPWAGVGVRDFEIYSLGDVSPELRLFQVKEIDVDPSWLSLLKGEKRWEKVELKDLTGEISIEQLKEIITRYQENRIVHVVETQRKRPLPPKEDPMVDDPKQSSDQVPQPAVRPTVSQENENDHGVISESLPVDDFEGSVVFSNANFRLYSRDQPHLELNFRDVAGEIPLWGGGRDGEFRIGEIKMGPSLTESLLVFPLRWEDGAIELEKSERKLFGVNLEISANVRMGAGFPVGLQIDLPDQKMDLSPIYPRSQAPIEVAQIRSQNVFQGHLTQLSGIQGSSVTSFRDFVFHDPKDGGDTSFDHGLAIMKLTSAGIVVDQIRAIGPEDSILANGFVTAGGDVAATVRVVSSPERANSHEKRIKDTSPSLALEFSPLVTPDREYRDIRIEARSGSLVVDLGVDEQWVPLFPTVRAILGNRSTPIPSLP